jgi:hypothetical protein
MEAKALHVALAGSIPQAARDERDHSRMAEIDRQKLVFAFGSLVRCSPFPNAVFTQGTTCQFLRYNPDPTESASANIRRAQMGFGRGVLLWLLGIPIPIILLLALFWHH